MSNEKKVDKEVKKLENRASGKFLMSVGLVAIGFLLGVYRIEVFGSIGRFFGAKVDNNPLNLSSVQETYNKIYGNFDGEIDREKLINGASKGLVEALGDEHTTYMTKKEYEDFEKNLSGDVGVGIGVEVGLRKKIPTVIRTLKGNPAGEAGIKAGDKILTVNGENVSEKTIEEITSKIKGEEGTTVKVGIVRDGEVKEFSIVRKKINNPSVEVEYDGDVAVLTISRFDGEAGSLARKYAQEIRDKGISKIILDLRDNGGGYVTAAQAVASLWLDSGSVIVQQKTGDKVTDTTHATGSNILKGTKTIILGNGNSASASEIVIGALKSHGAAEFYGQKTYGKGSVQTTFSTSSGVVKVTIAKWFTPDDKNIDKVGIEPDKKIELSKDDEENGADPQMSAAKEALK